MAIVRVSFYSSRLQRTVPFTAFLPNDGAIFPGQEMPYVTGKMRTLYLFHGMMGDENDFLSNTRVKELSEKYKIAVIMPAGENRFYVDDEAGVFHYGKYIGEELVEYTRRIFHLSDKREDTYIGGLSMGGYGAIRNGLLYAETFSKICAFSGAYIPIRIVDNGGEPFEDPISGKAFQEYAFGNLKTLEERGIDPRALYRMQKAKGVKLPKIFMTIGTEDNLIDVNRKLHEVLMKEHADLTYIEDNGIHNWDFWNKHMEEAFVWLADE